MNNANAATASRRANPDVNSQESEVKQAVDNLKPSDIQKNLDEPSQARQPEDLSEEQQTPFIEDDLRTDK